MPKTNAEKCREYRQKKKVNNIKKVAKRAKSPKSSTERVRKFRARRKALLNVPHNISIAHNNASIVENTLNGHLTNKMDNTPAVENPNNRNSKIEEEFNNCTVNKISVYETRISEGYIKREPCDTQDEPENNYNYVDIKEEIIEDPTIVVPETGFTANIKGNYLTCCEVCGEEYELYCLKCPMLIRIFNSNNPDLSNNRDTRTLPHNFVDMCETQSGLGIVALKIIPKGVAFGPFRGLDSIKDGAVSKWILANKELVFTKDPKRLNWMQYIRRVDQSSHPNLTSFQHADGLYYRSVCQISIGDELLVCLDSNRDESTTQDSFLRPQICESFDNVYACTLCCVGYKTICHLAVHNSRCPAKRDQNDFCAGFIQCAFCKIYLDKKEYSDYHMDQCCKSEEEIFALHQEKTQNQGKDFDLHLPHYTEVKPFAGTHSPYKTRTNLEPKQPMVIHSDDKSFACSLCSHKAKTKSLLKLHMSIHKDGKLFVCSLCPYKTKTNWLLRQHIVIHSDDKPFACRLCSFKTRTKLQLQRHNATHSDDKPFACSLCSHKTKTKSHLKLHMSIHKDGKPFVCSFCSLKTKTQGQLTYHLLSHNDDKPFECNHCPYKTKTSWQLKRHIATHSDDKPFSCSSCSFKAKRDSELKKHIAIHK